MRKIFVASIVAFVASASSFLFVGSVNAAYCWCFDTTAGSCPVQGAQWTRPQNDPNALVAITCDAGNWTSCGTVCGRNNAQAIHCDPDTNFQWDQKQQWQTDGTPGSYGGCMASVCTCRDQNNNCKSYPKNQNTQKYFLGKSDCDSYCSSLGDESASWKSQWFDNSPHNADPKCVPAKAAPTQSKVNTGGSKGDVDGAINALQQNAANHLNPGAFTQPTDLIGVAIRVMLGIIGSLALVLYIYSGILWMTAMGNSETTQKATDIIKWTTLGVAVMLMSYVIVTEMFRYLKLSV